MNILTRYLVLFISLISLSSLSLNAASPNPYDFNVFVSGNIGTAGTPYAGAEIQGLTGAGGNAYFSGFSLNNHGTAGVYPYSVYTGGIFSLNNSTVYNGGIESRGVVNVSGMTINGSINAGNNVNATNGTINGNVSAVGNYNASGTVLNGVVSHPGSYTPTVNLANVTSYFDGASNYYAGLTANLSSSVVYGQLVVSPLQSGLNIVNVTLGTLSTTYGVALSAMSGAVNPYVVFNIIDTTPSATALKTQSFTFFNGLTSDSVLFNLPNATQLNLAGQYYSILAPNATINFNSGGVLTGQLVAQDLYDPSGSGSSIALGSFKGFPLDQSHFVQVPEPGTYVILGSFIGIMALIARRRKAVSTSR